MLCSAALRLQGEGGGGELGEELLEEMEAAERKDRYIDQILRKRQGRPLGAAARGRKPAAQRQQAPAVGDPVGQPGNSSVPGQVGLQHSLQHWLLWGLVLWYILCPIVVLGDSKSNMDRKVSKAEIGRAHV